MTDPTAQRRGLFGRLYHGETDADFVGRWKLWFAISGLVILVGLVSLLTRGLNLGIDFEGGTVWELPSGGATIEDAQDALEPLGFGDAKIQTLSGGDDERLRVSARPEGDAEEREEQVTAVQEALAEVTGTPEDEVTVNSVGPSWGDEITSKAQRALVIFLIAIVIYITLRFEWKMALATLSALVHDLLVTVGVYSLFQFEVTPATVIAILTILGYSIYDGIVVFDKVDENTRAMAMSGRMTYAAMVNRSLNDVLMRTLNTSITALLPITSLLVIGSLVLGATTLQEFGLALLIGLGASAYSSIFIASPMLAILKEREPRYRALRERLAGRGPSVAAPSPAPVGATAGASSGATTQGDRPAPARPTQPTTAIPPRPRKKKRR
jgi:preprotein translocase subunit SecF